MNLRAFWVVLATSVNAKHVSLNPIGWLMFMQGTCTYMGTSPKQQEWWGKLIALGCIKLYTVNYLVAYVREHSPTAEKRIIRPERAFRFFCDTTKADLFQFLISRDKDDVREAVRALSFK